MSLLIDMDRVTEVLLADGWHEVARYKNGVSSFDGDAYEYKWSSNGRDMYVTFGEGSGVTYEGFSFQDAKTGDRIAGPFTSVLAVREKKETN